MKLQAGNPNLMRVNRETSLGAFAMSTGDKEQKKYRTGVKLIEKDANTALPNTTSIWAQPVYKPDHATYVRPGADDHLKYKSRGF